MVYKLGSDEGKEQIVTELKAIKLNIKQLYELVYNHLMASETNHTNSNTYTKEITDLFNSTKLKSITICNNLSLESILKQINELSILQIVDK